MQSRDELQEFFTSDEIDAMYEAYYAEEKKYGKVALAMFGIPTLIFLLAAGYSLKKETQAKKLENKSTIMQTFDENEHKVTIPLEYNPMEGEYELDYYEGYEIINLTKDSKATYTNIEPVKAKGIVLEDGTTEFISFGTPIEEEKSK